jgi:hypothetical protein
MARRIRSPQDGPEAEQVGAIEKIDRPLRPSECQKYLKRAVTRDFREIVKGFLEQARSGSCAHMKYAAEIVEPEKTPEPEQTGTMTKLLEELDRL